MLYICDDGLIWQQKIRKICEGILISAYWEKYCVSSITQGKEDFILHLVGGQLPQNTDIEHAALTLEDVYMYYFGGQSNTP